MIPLLLSLLILLWLPFALRAIARIPPPRRYPGCCAECGHRRCEFHGMCGKCGGEVERERKAVNAETKGPYR